jgi:hypothetical protein
LVTVARDCKPRSLSNGPASYGGARPGPAGAQRRPSGRLHHGIYHPKSGIYHLRYEATFQMTLSRSVPGTETVTIMD